MFSQRICYRNFTTWRQKNISRVFELVGFFAAWKSMTMSNFKMQNKNETIFQSSHIFSFLVRAKNQEVKMKASLPVSL